MLKPVTRIAAACALIFSQSSQSATLQEVLRQSFSNDPELLEAQANRDAANTDVKIAKSGHLPTMTLTAAQVLAQKHRYESNERPRGIDPGLQGKLNLYSFGGVDARVRYSEHKYDYYHHKYYETQETVGQTIGQLYLSALRAKENIVAAQSNLQRHEQIINDLQIIAKYDKGRQSELDQAMARRLRVQAYLAEQTRSMELYLSRLGKYTQRRLNPATLTDPFAGENANSIVKRYQNMDLGQQPSYQAQQAERESVLAELDVNKSARYPAIDLIASASRDNKEIYLNFNWDFYSPSANYQVEKSGQTLVAAEAKSDQILRDVAERSRSSEVDMRQSLNRFHIAQQQIAAQKKVIKAYELQFKIARRTLIDVLDSYSDLWSIESEMVASQNDFRDAALEYLSSQAAIARFAGIVEDRSSPERKVRRSFREHLPDEFLPKSLQERFDKIDFDAIDREVGQLGDQLNYLKDKTKEKLDKILPDVPADGANSSRSTTSAVDTPTVDTSSAADYPVIVDSNTINADSNQPYVPTGKAAAKAKISAAKAAKSARSSNQVKVPTASAQPQSSTTTPVNKATPVITPTDNTVVTQQQGVLPNMQPETTTVETRPAMSEAQSMPDKVLNYDDIVLDSPKAVGQYSSSQQLNYDEIAMPNTSSVATASSDMERNPIKYVTFRDSSVATPTAKAAKSTKSAKSTKATVVSDSKAVVDSAKTSAKSAKAAKVAVSESKTVVDSVKTSAKSAKVAKVAVSESKTVVDSTKTSAKSAKSAVVSDSKAVVDSAKTSAKTAKAAKAAALESSLETTQPKVKLVESPEHGVMMQTPSSSSSLRDALPQNHRSNVLPALKEKADAELKEATESLPKKATDALKDMSSQNELPTGLTFEARVPYEMTT